MKGLTTDDFFAPEDARVVTADAFQAAARRAASLARREYITIENRLWGYVRMLLPLSADGVAVTGFVKTIDPDSLIGMRPAAA